MPTAEEVAHDLAMVYITNRYGAEVKGTMSISTGDKNVSGAGPVETVRMPDPGEVRVVDVPTGESRLFGLWQKTTPVEEGLQVEHIFGSMLDDYRSAYDHFLRLLQGD